MVFLKSNPGGLMLKCPTRYEEMEPADAPHEVQDYKEMERKV